MDVVWGILDFGVTALYIVLFIVGFIWTWRLTRGLRLNLWQVNDGSSPVSRFPSAMWPIRFFAATVVGLVAASPARLLALLLDAVQR